MKSDDRVAGVGLQRRLDQLEQGLRHGLPIQGDVGPKEPVPAAQHASLGM